MSDRPERENGAKSKQEEPAGASMQKPEPKYVLRLYVTGLTPSSRRAIRNLEEICRDHLKGDYDLQIIDVRQQPTLAKGDQIVAAPTLVKKLPAPLRRLVGDLSETDKVLLGLELKKTEK